MRLTRFRPRIRRHASTALLAPLMLLLGACASAPAHPDTATTGSALTRDNLTWLRRDGFGVNGADVTRYRALGREGLLDAQLADRTPGSLPPQIASLIHGFEATRTPLPKLLADLHDAQEQAKALSAGPERDAANKAWQKHGYELMQQARQAELLQAVYGPNQLKEQLVWFWLNHFSVYAPKGRIRWELADYAQRVIRPHALGKFKDLVMATLESPAMLEYLDNAQNAKGHVNENYARELMELHTLGVGSGYTQQDVQQLALILTGVGIAPIGGKPQRFNAKAAPLVVRHGLFEFNPYRHDFRDKVFLGQRIKGRGFDEVKQALDLIVHQPACARFISRQLAQYFVADDPPPALVARMALTFRQTDGDIAAVLRTLFDSSELLHSGRQFIDPTRFVVSSVRLAYDGKPIANAPPLVYWLDQLGEPLYGRITPDGWPLDGASWTGSGQLSKRFDIAAAIGNGNTQLFTPPGSKTREAGFPMLATRLYYDAIEPHLSAATRSALGNAQSQQEWNTFLLASPDLNYR